MYPQGYGAPVRQDVLVERTDGTAGGYVVPEMKVGDPRLQLSHEQHVARGKAVDEGKILASRAGCKGLSVVARFLSYVDCNNIFLLPAFHGLVYGLGKSFLNLILEV